MITLQWLLVASVLGSPQISNLTQLAGDYFHGNGLGTKCRLTLNETGSFTFQWTGCLGIVDQNAGPARLAGGYLLLKPTEPTDLDSKFVPVGWGKRTYLIPKKRGKDFCNEVNTGIEPRDGAIGRHYLRHDDWKLKVDGLPAVPKEWSAWLLPKPIEGVIIEENPDKTGKVNLGSKDGVWAGMELFGGGSKHGFAVVESVEADSCIVKAGHDDTNSGFKKGSKVKSNLRRGL